MKAFSPKSTPEAHRSPSSANAYSHRQAQQQSHPATLIQRAKLDPKSLTPRDVLQLQRTIGNHAVGRLLTQGGVLSEAATARASGFVDNRPEALAQRKLQAMMNQSPQVQRQTPLQAMIDHRPRQVAQQKQLERMFGPAVQRQEGVDEETLQMQAEPGTLQRQNLEDEALLQGKVEPVQRQEELEDEELIQGKSDPVPRQDLEEEEEPLQGTFDSSTTPTPPGHQENHTGMPDNLKAGIENLSGMSMDDVTVHYNSSKPAQLQALAYTQGTDIHVGPGRQKHLPHEAWHVVQQKQGRVKPTMRAKGVAINADTGLEHEADVMGAKAMQMRQADPLPTGSAAQATTAESRERVQPEAAEVPSSDVGASGEKVRLNFLSSLQAMVEHSPRQAAQRKQLDGVFHQTSNRGLVVQRAITVESTTYPYGGDSRAQNMSLREFRRTLMLKLKEHDFKELGSRAMWNFVNERLASGSLDVGTWPEFLESMWDDGLLQRMQRGSSFGPKNLGSRPTWFPATTNEMPVGFGQHRRHIISSSSLGRGIEKAYEQLKVNVPDSIHRLECLNAWLGRNGGTDQTTDYAALRLMWRIVHNHQGNLWVGEGNWNSAIGFIRPPLAGLLATLQGPGTVKLNELLADINGIKPSLKLLAPQWVEIRNTLRDTVAHAEPHISTIGFGAAFIKWNEEVNTIKGSDADEGYDVYRELDRILTFPGGYEPLSTVTEAVKALMASRRFYGDRKLLPVYLKWLDAYSYAPDFIRKSTARALIQDWISNADLDYPYELIKVDKPEYFAALVTAQAVSPSF